MVLRPGARLVLEDIIEFMRAQEIAPFKIPEVIELFDELPRTGADKLSKVAMKSAIAERQAGR